MSFSFWSFESGPLVSDALLQRGALLVPLKLKSAEHPAVRPFAPASAGTIRFIPAESCWIWRMLDILHSDKRQNNIHKHVYLCYIM